MGILGANRKLIADEFQAISKQMDAETDILRQVFFSLGHTGRYKEY